MAAPLLRGQTAPVAGGSASSPASTQVGDLVIVYTFERLAGAAGSTLSINAGAGFSQIRNHFHDDGTTDGALAVAYKVATQAGAQSYQGFTSSTGTPVWWTGCTVLQAGTFDAAAIVSSGVTQTNNAVPNPPSIAGLTSTRDYLVLAIAAWHLGSSVANTATAPTNYTNLVQLAGAATGDLAAASRAISGATSEDPGTFGDDQAPNGTAAITIAIPNKLPPGEGQGTAALTLGGTGEGRTARYSASAVAPLVLGGTGTGEAPATSIPEGFGVAALTLSGSGEGRTVRRGNGTAALSLSGAGAGATMRSGSGIAALALASTGEGRTTRAGSGQASLALSGIGTGARVSAGFGSGALLLSGTGEGMAPGALSPAEGFGIAALVLSGTGEGQASPIRTWRLGVLDRHRQGVLARRRS